MEQEQIPLDAVLNYDLPIEKIVARLSGRRTCPKCKAVFHVTGRPPRVNGICNHCGQNFSSARMTGPKPSACAWRFMKRAPNADRLLSETRPAGDHRGRGHAGGNLRAHPHRAGFRPQWQRAKAGREPARIELKFSAQDAGWFSPGHSPPASGKECGHFAKSRVVTVPPPV